MNFSQKSQLLKQLYDEKKCQSFVETGTYEGRMVSFVVQDIKTPVVRSIELNEKLAKLAVGMFQAHEHVKIVQGDSNVELANVMTDPLVVRPLIWLDAHWSDGKTSRSANGKDTPISEELQAIKDCGKSCIVAIDDIRCFDGKNGYPTVQDLYVAIGTLWPDTAITHVDDAVWFEVT
jgi:hypothetical protein